MARIITRALPLSSRSSPRPRLSISYSSLSLRPLRSPIASSSSSSSSLSPISSHLSLSIHPFGSSRRSIHEISPFGGIFASLRGFRRTRRRLAAKKKSAPKEKELQLDVKICIEEELPEDPEVMSISEMLKLNVPMAMKIAFDGLHNSKYKTRDASISDVGVFDKAELSLLLCNDDFMQKLNKEWRGVDATTDVLSMSQHIPELENPTLLLGDIVISVETAARQAEERGHTLLDEIRILMVHGLLHLLGFDHEISEEAEAEMQKEEEIILKSLGWKGKGLITGAYDNITDVCLQSEGTDGIVTKNMRKAGSLRFYKPKFSYIFCDMDGTLLNSKSQISTTTAEALKEAILRGVNIVIATGKTRPAAINALKMVNLTGKDGIVSESSPGIFLQLQRDGLVLRLSEQVDLATLYLWGLLVYGRQGREIARRNLDQNVCREAFLYSLENEIPLIAFCQDRCFTLYDHPMVDSLHTIYHEPKAEVMPSIDQLLAAAEIQKLLFLDSAEGISSVLRPHWEEATEGRAGVTQGQPDMLEIVPAGTSKGDGVRMLLDHLGISPKEVMAIGDGENDVEMLELASLGVALSNGSDKTKAVADVIGATNDEDGVAQAIYGHAF